MTSTAHKNRLQDETSPYLLQHADNPVDWYPWSEEALTRAKQENKPILLSIGYSACHWCHVMAHESFEDEEIAALMNKNYINIKVDREERPDLDKIYQLAHQLLTRRAGGWPLTMFLSPGEHIPFFGGTYFPKVANYNMPAFPQLLQMVADYFHREQHAISQQNSALLDSMAQLAMPPKSEQPLDESIFRQARQELEENFDNHHGGFGQAPKFPHCTNIDLLLRRNLYGNHRDHNAWNMGAFTLQKMAEGGIYDQLGGGFCRYSVDDLWMIPHFEKMLYDNGPLLALCAQTWQITQASIFKRVAQETAEWVMREMQSPEGGYYSSLDADSEGHEGAFYVWNKNDVQSALSAEEFAVLAPHYGLSRPANFEGKWHFYIAKPLEEVASSLGLDKNEAQQRLANAQQKLMAIRDTRIRPGRDNKILGSWNALMIRGMVIAGRALQRPEWVKSARSAFDFIHQKLWQNKQLLATYKDGKAHLDAYLDDYAFLLDAGLELLQNDWDAATLEWLDELAEILLTQFQNDSHGGFYFTANNHEYLIQRPMPVMDEAMPSGNGIAACALIQLGQLLGKASYIEAGQRAINVSAKAIARIPHAHASLLNALDLVIQPAKTIIIQGPDRLQWQQSIQSQCDPKSLCFAIDKPHPLLNLNEPTESAKTTAQVCTGNSCLPTADSLTDLNALLEQLDN